MKSRQRNHRRTFILTVALLAPVVVVVPTGAWAQLEDSFEEQQVETVEEREEAEQESVREALEAEPHATARWFEELVDFEQLERLQTARSRLIDMLDETSSSDANRPTYMFRLAELDYTLARLFEQRSYERLDRAYEVRQENPAQANQYQRAAEDDLEQSDTYALHAIEVYVELYREYHDTYPDMDGVLFYMGSTLSQLGRLEDALDFFEELANDYPTSPYLPQALLAFGEYHFHITGDMQEAQMFYQAVAEFPDSTLYPYALYQEGWCFYNTGDYESAMQRLLDAIEASEGETAGRIRMRRRALHDLALFYVEVGTAENAFYFFETIAPDLAFELVEMVAQVFSEDGHYDQANDLFRELMDRNRESFDIVDYQYEIVRNTLPGGDEEDIIREVRRLVQLFASAQEFEDASEERVRASVDNIEYQVRRLATTYHRDAQVLNNDEMYALAYNLYQDYVVHLNEFADQETRYTMTFYYADLLFKNDRYEDAARTWELCLDINPEGQYNEEAIYKTILAIHKAVEEQEIEPPDYGELADGEIPEPLPLPEIYQWQLRASERYLDLNPPDEFAVEVEFVAAYTLYTYAHLEEAAERFERIALTYIDADRERAQASAELLLDTLGALQDFTAMESAINQLRETALNRGEFAVRLSELGQEISFGRCREIQLAEQYEDAGLCFFEFFTTYHDSDLVDRALYNAGLCFDAIDDIRRAIRVREFLVQYRSDSELVPEVIYNLGQLFHRLALYRLASQYYEQYARQYPEEETAVQAMANAAVFRQGLGEFDEAISNYSDFIELFEDREEEVAAAYFQIGVIYQDRGETGEALGQFDNYIDDYADQGPPGLAIEASTRIGRMQWDNGRRERAEEWFIQTLDRFNALTPEEAGTLDAHARDAAAEARFMLGEQIFIAFSALEIAGTEIEVQEQLRQKWTVAEQASEVYMQVEAFQRPGWSIAAYTRLGQLLHEFYDAVINAPVPADMTYEQEETYRAMLHEASINIRDAAILNYQYALEIARVAGWFNEYSELAEQNLAVLDSSFRAGNELRSEPTHEPDTYFMTGFVTSLEGEEAEASEEEPETEESTDDEEDRDVPPQVSESDQ